MIRRYSATDRVQETRTPDTTEFHDIMLESQSSGIIFSAHRPKSKIYQFSLQQYKYQYSETAFLNFWNGPPVHEMAHGCVFLANDLDHPDGPACCKKDGLTVRNIFICKLYGPSAFVVLIKTERCGVTIICKWSGSSNWAGLLQKGWSGTTYPQNMTSQGWRAIACKHNNMSPPNP